MELIGIAQAGAGLINLGQDVSSPYYADFGASRLNVFYDYTGTTGPNANGSGSFHVFNTYRNGHVLPTKENYESSSASPGTGSGSGRPNGFNDRSFRGSYSIDATISIVNGVVSLAGGTVKVFGNSFGGATGDLLLQGSLQTGLGGVAFGYVDPSGAATPGKYDLFQFIFSVTGGKPAIVADYMGLGGTGGIILDANFDALGRQYNGNNGSTSTSKDNVFRSYQGFNGDWTRDFSNPLNSGCANTFVPEPTIYPLAGGVMALIGLMAARRNFGGGHAVLK